MNLVISDIFDLFKLLFHVATLQLLCLLYTQNDGVVIDSWFYLIQQPQDHSQSCFLKVNSRKSLIDQLTSVASLVI